MQLRNTSAGYGLIAQLLHWAVAGLIAYQYILADRAEQATLFQKLGIYFSRWLEFLTEEPREANTEGGVIPAIFGTFAMTYAATKAAS